MVKWVGRLNVLTEFIASNKRRFLLSGVVLLLIAAGGALGLIIASSVFGSVNVPPAILQNAKSPIYIPHYLPSGYKIVNDSFSFAEDALIFSARDSAGSTLVFTERPRPADFNFDEFYARQMGEVTTIDSAPYAGVSGKTEDGRFLLSVVTEDTWVIMTAAVSPQENDIMQIAKGLKRL